MMHLPLALGQLSLRDYWSNLRFCTTISFIVYKSIHLLHCNFVHLDDSVAVSNENSCSQGIPGNRCDLVILSWLWLLAFCLSLSHFLQLEFSISNDWSILWFEVPNSPSDFGSNGNPMAFWVEGDRGNGSRSIVNWVFFFDIGEFINFDLLIFSTCNDEVTLWRNSKAVNVGIMGSEAILNVEGLIVPNFKISVPSNWSEEMSSDAAFAGGGNVPDLRNPILMVVVLNCVSAFSSNIPQLDASVSTWWKNISSVIWNSAGQDFLLVLSSKSLSGLSCSQIPKSHFFIPGGWEQMVVVVGEGEVTDEVGVSS